MTTLEEPVPDGPSKEIELSCDAITRDFRIYQRRGGHRYSLDDVATASEAARARPDACHYLDLGCGIGSVLLMLSWRLTAATVYGIEALPMSLALARRSVALNGISDRVTLIDADHRDQTRDWPHPECDLVTGTPPYLRLGTAVVSPDPQRAAARMELRGGVEGYLLSASRVLAPDGRVVVCASCPERVRAGAEAAELTPLRRRDIWPRADAEAPLFAVWTLGHRQTQAPPLHHTKLVIRAANGEQTPEALQMRADFGLAP
jgi:tRNA1(Val) A37 N6-methylase TrmN6